MSGFTSIELGGLSPADAYRLLSTLIVPRPIAFVSTLSREQIPNLAPFSYFMVGGANPPSLMFSPTTPHGGQEKDTLRNCRETGEFVVNLVDRAMADGMNASSRSLPPDESEWPLTGFHPEPSVKVRPTRVRESFVQFECTVHEVVRHGSGPGAANYVIGEVLVAHLREDLIVDGKVDPHVILPIARLGGDQYLDLAGVEVFRLARP